MPIFCRITNKRKTCITTKMEYFILRELPIFSILEQRTIFSCLVILDNNNNNNNKRSHVAVATSSLLISYMKQKPVLPRIHVYYNIRG